MLQVILLDLQMNNAQKLTKGEEVLAVYPDTTSFYMATVTQVSVCVVCLLEICVCVTWNHVEGAEEDCRGDWAASASAVS